MNSISWYIIESIEWITIIGLIIFINYIECDKLELYNHTFSVGVICIHLALTLQMLRLTFVSFVHS